MSIQQAIQIDASRRYAMVLVNPDPASVPEDNRAVVAPLATKEGGWKEAPLPDEDLSRSFALKDDEWAEIDDALDSMYITSREFLRRHAAEAQQARAKAATEAWLAAKTPELAAAYLRTSSAREQENLHAEAAAEKENQLAPIAITT